MKLANLACLTGLLLGATQLANASPTDFADGLRDRTSYEEWYSGLTGTYKEGVFYWVGQRSQRVPGACSGGPSEDWVKGCIDAKARLDPTDNRRLTQPDYRKGWNSFSQENPTSPHQQPIKPTDNLPPRQNMIAGLTREANSDCSVATLAPPYRGYTWEQANEMASSCERTRSAAQSALNDFQQRQEQDAAREKTRIQTEAENSSSNYCKQPAFARLMMSSIDDLRSFKLLDIHVEDIEHLTTVSFSSDSQEAVCHGVFVFNNGRRMSATFTLTKNVAGDGLIRWKPD